MPSLTGGLARKEAAAPRCGCRTARGQPSLRACSRTSSAPVMLLTGRVDRAVAWQQALETWLPRA